MQEKAHAQGSLMLRNEIRDWPRQAVAPSQFEAFVHMGLEHSGTGDRVVQFGVWILLSGGLIFDEPVRSMEFAYIVIKGSCFDQIHIGPNRTRSLLCQSADHQRVFKRSRCF